MLPTSCYRTKILHHSMHQVCALSSVSALDCAWQQAEQRCTAVNQPPGTHYTGLVGCAVGFCCNGLISVTDQKQLAATTLIYVVSIASKAGMPLTVCSCNISSLHFAT